MMHDHHPGPIHYTSFLGLSHFSQFKQTMRLYNPFQLVLLGAGFFLPSSQIQSIVLYSHLDEAFHRPALRSRSVALPNCQRRIPCKKRRNFTSERE